MENGFWRYADNGQESDDDVYNGFFCRLVLAKNAFMRRCKRNKWVEIEAGVC